MNLVLRTRPDVISQWSDEASLLACAAYVDLNPIRAAIAEAPETSDYTGAKDRIDVLDERVDR